MEMMNIPRFRYLLSLAAVLCLAACQSDMLSKLGVSDPTQMFESMDVSGAKGATGSQDNMVVNKVEFSKGHKTFAVWTGILRDIGPYPLTDSTVVRIDVEAYDNGVKCPRAEQPRLLKAWNTERDRVKYLGIKALVIVDLSLSQEQINAQLDAVKEMLTVFDKDNLYLAFMSGNAVTPCRPVSDYVLENYFKKWSDQKLLYRSVLQKIQEIKAGQDMWADATQTRLVVFSDGLVYDKDNIPYDQDHFNIENQLLQSARPGKEHLSVFFVNFGKEEEMDPDSESHNVFSSVCENSGGAFLPSFSWTLLETAMLGHEIHAVESNRFDFINPDGKVYRGDDQQLKIRFFTVKDNKLIASATANIREGSFYKPIIVNGASLWVVIAEGLSVGLFLLLAIYLIFQYLVPYIQYRLFLKKYVIRHTGKSMVMGDVAVAESCYLCKAPFEEGDEVVVKCQHTMHKHCWDENEYHCPEFGRHCKEGSHYYNKENLQDKRNAPYYLNWLLMAVIAGTLAWVVFTISTHQDHVHLLQSLVPEGPLAEQIANAHLNPLPTYGFALGFFLTMGISLLAFRRIRWAEYLDIFLRSLVAGIICGLLFLLVSLACIALRMESVAFFMNLIPWAISSFVIAYIGTFGSRIQLKKSIILIAVGVAVVSMLLWSWLYMQIGVDFRILMLYSTLIYMIGIATAIATAAPRSEHYFLHLEGAVKSMDVALYKWFRSHPAAVVSIGKSVDCSLQLTWDLQGKVAPVHALIYRDKGLLRLKALEAGVSVNGRELAPEQSVRLYHGKSFSIGNTHFTYQEKDI